MIDISIALSDDGKTGTIVIAGVPVTGAAVSPPPPPPVEEPPPVLCKAYRIEKQFRVKRRNGGFA